MFEPLELLPGHSPEAVAERVGRSWEFVCGKFPFPKFEPCCPQCGPQPVGNVQVRQITFWSKDVGTDTPHRRADVLMKCCVCSLGWTYGVSLTEDIYVHALKDGKRVYQWREIRAEIEEAS